MCTKLIGYKTVAVPITFTPFQHCTVRSAKYTTLIGPILERPVARYCEPS